MAKNYSYYSNVLKKPFDTVEELQKAEAKYNEEILAKQKAQEQRKARAAEVESALKAADEAYKKYTKLLNAFVKDYGSYHTTITESNSDLTDLTNNLFNIFKLF